MPHALDFSLAGLPVGQFLKNCPHTPGRYEYTPYRGEGHAKFGQKLRQGIPVVCSVLQGWKTIRLVITSEEFVEETADCHWFVQVAEVHTKPRGLILALLALLVGVLFFAIRDVLGK